jgi:hypothetical protein
MVQITAPQILDEPSPDEFKYYSGFVITRLLTLGLGCVEADCALAHDGKVDFVWTPRRGGQPNVIGSLAINSFIPALARFGPWCGHPDLLLFGHCLFTCYHESDGEVKPHGFSLYVCNTNDTGQWVRLYLYGIGSLFTKPWIQ